MKKDICTVMLLAGVAGVYLSIHAVCFEKAWDVNDRAICLQCAQDLLDEFKVKYGKDENDG